MRRFGAGLASADPAAPFLSSGSAMPSHPLLGFTGDVRKVGGLLQLHVSAASRIAESNEALRRPRNRAVQQDERSPQIPVMEEASLRRDLVRLVSDFQDPLVVLRPLMVAELAPLRHGRADVPGLEIPERSDVPSVLRVLVTQETRAPARVVALPAFPLRDRRDVDHRTLAAKFGDGNLLSQESACVLDRSEERRVGKECRYRWSPYHEQKNKMT